MAVSIANKQVEIAEAAAWLEAHSGPGH
jgi:hypothetical protein